MGLYWGFYMKSSLILCFVLAFCVISCAEKKHVNNIDMTYISDDGSFNYSLLFSEKINQSKEKESHKKNEFK